MQKFDVIIAGAGPAGLNCAKTLSKTDLKILILEKNKIIGPKICAGGLTNKSYLYLQSQGLPENLISKKFEAVTMHTPFNTTTINSKDCIVATIDRKDLGQWQLSELQQSNITIRTNSRVSKINIEDNSLHIGNEKIYYDYLVGADGAMSIVKRTLGFSESANGVGIQYILPYSDRFDKLELFFADSLFKVHYAWIFPHKNFVSIGSGADLNINSFRSLFNNFQKWLKKNNIDVTNLKFQSFPFNLSFHGFQFDNVFLAGEAAGLVSSFTGEGIYQALVSGEEIAKKILNSSYDLPKMKELIHRNYRHSQIENIFKKSRFLRKIEFELIALMLKNQKFADKVLKRI